MKEIVFIVMTKMPTIVCVVASAWLAYKNNEAWPWFLFVALLVTSSIKMSD